MKVAHLTTVDMSLRYLLLSQLRMLREQGDEVIGMSAPGPWVDELEGEGFRHIAVESSTRSSNAWADARAMLELWRALRRERPDVLHTHNPKPGVYGRIVGRLAGVPIVVNTVHGLYATSEDPWAKRLSVYALEALAARFSDAELIQNPEDFELMRRVRITKRARLIGNGVDLRRFDGDRFSTADRTAMRTTLGARDGQIVVGTVGRLVAEKGYPELFDAIRRLDADRYLLVVAGAEDPERPDALAQEELRRAREDGVRLLGHRDDVDALYAAMDVFVLASHREGYPRAAMEAAAIGLPIVATDIRGCRQVVDAEHNGVLVPVRDSAAIASAIAKLGDSPALRTQMGNAGRVLARCRFDEQKVARAVADTYRHIAARKGVPAERVDVLQVITSDDRRGPETHAVDLATALEARGSRVRTVALAPGSYGGGLPVPTLGARRFALRTLRRLRREAEAATIVVAHGSASLPACAFALAGTHIPLVYRNIGDPRVWANTRVRRARVRMYLRRAQAVVALTGESAATFQSHYGLPSERITVIPIGVPTGRHFPTNASSRRQARNRLGIPIDADVGTIVGALSTEKDVASAIDAAATIPDFHLVIVGDGSERKTLEELAETRAAGRVHFAGSLPDPSPAFAAADLVLLTSRTEGLPAVLIEAGMRELPVVATNVGYVREIVVDGKTGLLVDPGEPRELVTAITRTLRDTHLGSGARRHCMQRFDLDDVAASWQDLLIALSKASGRRRGAVSSSVPSSQPAADVPRVFGSTGGERP